MAFARKRRMMQELLILAAAARHGTFSAAGREMGITQSAVSHCVTELERELGVPLFTRHWRGAKPTEAGLILLDAVSRGASVIDAGVAEVRRLAAARKSLTIVTDFGFASLWLLPRLDRLRSILPGLAVHILTTQSSAAMDLRLGDAVVAFGADPPQGWEVTAIAEEIVSPVASPAFLARNPVQGLDDLARAPLLHLDVPEAGRWIDWSGYFALYGKRGTQIEGALTFNNYPLLIQAAVAGQGVALGWEPLVSDLVQRGMLANALPPFATGARGYDFIAPREKISGSPLTHVRDWIIKEVSSSAPETR